MNHISDADNVWITKRQLGPDKILYCQANKANKEEQKPNPICYETELMMIKGNYNFK